MSRTMSKVLAIIMAGGQGERLSLLSQKRAKPAVPFAGKYRIIDFALSNCVNSGITDVAVLTQYRPHSLHNHIGIGRPWDLDRQKGGIHLLQPYLGRQESDWYQGTADAVYQNLDFVMEARYDYVLAGHSKIPIVRALNTVGHPLLFLLARCVVRLPYRVVSTRSVLLHNEDVSIGKGIAARVGATDTQLLKPFVTDG
jgi:hypothetical protein